jgi:hypothetical protein
MKFAYFNPTVMGVETIPEPLFDTFKAMVDVAHTNAHLNDEGDPKISIRGGQQVQLLPNEFGLDIVPLKEFVEANCRVMLDTILAQSGRNDLNIYDPVLISAWTIKQSPGDYQALHTHEAHISGNIYIEVPALDPNSKTSDAQLEFRLPVIRNPANFIFSDQWRYTPTAGTMVMFPSYVPHTVYPWSGSGHRTVLAWDVKLVPKKS